MLDISVMLGILETVIQATHHVHSLESQCKLVVVTVEHGDLQLQDIVLVGTLETFLVRVPYTVVTQ